MLKEHLMGSPGYFTGYRLENFELEILRQFIKPKLQTTHDALSRKAARLFSTGEVARIIGFEFMRQIEKELGTFKLSDVCYGNQIEKGRREAYFRVVRPFNSGDVGEVHRDCHHHEALPGLHSPDDITFKCWIAVETEPGFNGLTVWPDSHRKGSVASVALKLSPGEIVIFHEKLGHQGAMNCGMHDRISVEITLVFPRKDFE